MAKDITENENYEQFPTTGKPNDILFRSHLEYTAGKLFWSSVIGLSAVTVYASLVYLVVQQLRK